MNTQHYNHTSRLADFFNVKPDSRSVNWPLVANPYYTFTICITYAVCAKFLGPKLMENRKPLQLKNILLMYNLGQVIFSAWIFYQLGMGGWFTGEYSLVCQPVDYSNNPNAMRMVHASWWYFFSKFTEFLDTAFFILRKKFDQVSTLHVIHHGIMPMSVWFGVKYCPGGHSTFFGLLNTFVHIVMYSYYFLSALGPKVQKYLWWKKYLTMLQMVQFIAVMIHAFQLFFIDCNYPKVFAWWIGSHGVLFFFLFKDFYKKTYIARKLAARNAKKSNENDIKNGTTLSNGITNGKLQNGSSIYKNGGISNGSIRSTSETNGGIKDASEYYIKGIDVTTDLHQRFKIQ